MNIINNSLKWDGSYLGSFNSNVIIQKWMNDINNSDMFFTLELSKAKKSLCHNPPKQNLPITYMKPPPFSYTKNKSFPKAKESETGNDDVKNKSFPKIKESEMNKTFPKIKESEMNKIIDGDLGIQNCIVNDSKGGMELETQEYPEGYICCMAKMLKYSEVMFACISEALKEVFGIKKRGLHWIQIDNKYYVLYYMQVTVSGEIVSEIQLNHIDNKHELRTHPIFKRDIQKIIIFRDILALTEITESVIRIRVGINDDYVPISCNEYRTKMMKNGVMDLSLISKTMFNKWFGEKTSISEIIEEMIDFHLYPEHCDTRDLEPKIKTPEILSILLFDIRNKIYSCIEKYDKTYVWYASVIMDRMSRHMLANI